MSRILRTLALSATFAALAASAQAGGVAIELDFEALGAQSQIDGKGIAVDATFSGLGLNFIGATAFHDNLQPSLATPSGSGFIWSDGQSMTIDVLAGSVLNFAKLTFEYGVNDVAFTVTVIGTETDQATGKAKQTTKDIAGTGGGFAWSGASKEIDISAIGPIDSIVFSSNTGRGLITLDNFKLLPDSTSPGGNVPEPASYGLVGLALLGAGLSTRRRRQG